MAAVVLTVTVGPLGPALARAEDAPARPGDRVRVTTVGGALKEEVVGVLRSVDALLPCGGASASG